MEVLTPDVLNPNATIWRYMDYESLMWTIQTNKLHFHRSDCFDDPLEGSVPNALKDISKKSYDQIRTDPDENIGGDSYDPKEQLKAFTKSMRRATFLNCWHINEGESAAMWELYGKSNKSLAIRSTVNKLMSSINEPNGGITWIGPVFYADYESSWDNLDRESRRALATIFSKDRYPTPADFYQIKEKSFNHERELRIIYQSMDVIGESEEDDSTTTTDELPFETEESEFFASGEAPAAEGFNTTIDADELIEAIHMAPQAPPTVQESLAGVLDDDASTPISSDRLVPTTIPGDPTFETGTYQFERLVDAAPEDEMREN